MINLPIINNSSAPYSDSQMIKEQSQIDYLENQEIERVCLSANSICNLGCRYCYFFNPENHIENNRRLSSDEIYTILKKNNDYAVENNVRKKIKVNFVGSGEPLISWKEIVQALKKFHEDYPNHMLRFYTVTNGTLLSQKIIDEMQFYKLTPSVSLDGPEEIHNANRIDKFGRGTFHKVIEGIELLRRNKMLIVINTTITYNLLEKIDDYFTFLLEFQVDKVIFDRLVDVPKTLPSVPYSEYYDALDRIYNYKQNSPKYEKIEIGNFEAYRRAIIGTPDIVCTMFGSTCGAGTNNIIYLQRDVYPCGRMFGLEYWKLGKFDTAVNLIQTNIVKKYPKTREECEYCDVLKICIKDCLIEELLSNYDCEARKLFLRKYKLIL